MAWWSWRNEWMKDVKCLEQSDDLNWLFFGGRVINGSCELMDECYECWPLCTYCGFTCNPYDGICENDEYHETGETCPTSTDWAFVGYKMTGLPWFVSAYLEVAKAADANPYTPPEFVEWWAPMVLSELDQVVYYPQSIVAFNTDTVYKTLRRCWLITYLPKVSLRLRFRDARAPWRNEWSWRNDKLLSFK